jgi:glycosyltransferase involved in cell wall biosynthesis
MKTKSPTLSIVTRNCCRPTELQRCVNSVLNQTDPDFEHIIISDDEVQGLHWANQQIKEQAGKLHGQYVYILDDDDYIVNNNFIEDLKALLENLNEPDVIICRGQLNGKSYPTIWKEHPQRGKIAAPNLITRVDIFNDFAYRWDQPRAGDFFFIKEIYNSGYQFFWWNYEVFWAESSVGLTEEQKEMYGFYGE